MSIAYFVTMWWEEMVGVVLDRTGRGLPRGAIRGCYRVPLGHLLLASKVSEGFSGQMVLAKTPRRFNLNCCMCFFLVVPAWNLARVVKLSAVELLPLRFPPPPGLKVSSPMVSSLCSQLAQLPPSPPEHQCKKHQPPIQYSIYQLQHSV